MIDSFVKPESLEQALDLLSSGEFTPIAGGTDIIPQLRVRKISKLLDIGRLGLDFIKINGDIIEIGAAATHARLHDDDIIRKYLPLLSETCSQVGSAQIRNRGTIGGNIINASPCADTVPSLVTLEAELVILSTKGGRQVKIGEFTKGPYRTGIEPDELLYSILCKIPEGQTGYSYLKLGRRQAVNISRMTISTGIGMQDDLIKWARIAGGSVFPVPARFTEVEGLITGQKPSQELFEDAGSLAADCMIRDSGLRWSTPYKKPVLTGLVAGALEQATKERK